MKVRSVISSFIAVLAATIAVGCGPSTPGEWDEISAKVYCKKRIKTQLRDPDSYQHISVQIVSTNGKYDQYGIAMIKFRSKNGFGGYVNGSAYCEAYEKNGELWVKTKLL